MSIAGNSVSGRSIVIDEIPSHVKKLKKEISRILFSYFLYYKNHPEWEPKEDLYALRKTEQIEKITWNFHKDPRNHPLLLAYHDIPHSLNHVLVTIGKKNIEEIEEQDLAIALRPENQIAIPKTRELESETSSLNELRPPRKRQSTENPILARNLEEATVTNSQLTLLVNKYFDEGLTLKGKAIEEVKLRDTEIEQLQHALQESKNKIRPLTEKISLQGQQISQFNIERLEFERTQLELRSELVHVQKNNNNNLALVERIGQANLEQNDLIKTLEIRNLDLENEFEKTLQKKQIEFSAKCDEINELRRDLQETQTEKQQLEREKSNQVIKQKYLQDQVEIIKQEAQGYREHIETLESTNIALQSQIIAQKQYLEKETSETQDQFKALQEQNAYRQEQVIKEIKRNYDVQFDRQLKEKIREFQKTEEKLIKEKQQFGEQTRLEFQQNRESILRDYNVEKERLENTILELRATVEQKEQHIKKLNSGIDDLKRIHRQEMNTLTITKDQQDQTNEYEMQILKTENTQLQQDLQTVKDQMKNLETMMRQLIQRQESQPTSSQPDKRPSQDNRRPPNRSNRNRLNAPPPGNPDDDDPDDDDEDAESQPNIRGNYAYRPQRMPHDLLPNQTAPAKETIDIVPIFTGDVGEGAVNISEWTTKVDRARHWTMPEQHGLLLEKILTMKIKGRAQSCISNVDIYTYDQLKDVLIKRVNPVKSSLLLMNELTACIHTQGTIQEHNTRFRRIYISWLNAKRLELKQAHQTDESITIYLQISDKDIIQTYLQSLKEDTRAYLRTKDIYSLAQAEATAREHEDFKRSIQRQRGMFHEPQPQRRPEKPRFNHEKSRFSNKPQENRKFFSMNKPNVHHTEYNECDSHDEEEGQESMTEEERQYQNDIQEFDLDSINTTSQMKKALEYIMVMNHPDRKCTYCKRPGHTELYCNQKKKDQGIPSPFNKGTNQKKKPTQKGNQNFRHNPHRKKPPQQEVNTTNEEQESTSDDESVHDESTSPQ